RYTGLKEYVTLPHRSWVERPSGTVELPTITIPRAFDQSSMAFFKGAPAFLLGDSDQRVGLLAHPVRVDPFYLDTTEVSIGAHHAGMGTLPISLGDRPKPLRSSDPVVLLSWDQAVAYAERVGKRLPTEEEMEFAATAGGTRRFPWGDDGARLRDGDRWMWTY